MKLKSFKTNLSTTQGLGSLHRARRSQRERPESELTALVSLIRRVCELDETLINYKSVVDKNFKDWVFQKQAGTWLHEDEMEWLRMLKAHMADSTYNWTISTLWKARGRMHALFGDDMNRILEELNEALVA